jgi:hypothetical protein
MSRYMIGQLKQRLKRLERSVEGLRQELAAKDAVIEKLRAESALQERRGLRPFPPTLEEVKWHHTHHAQEAIDGWHSQWRETRGDRSWLYSVYHDESGQLVLSKEGVERPIDEALQLANERGHFWVPEDEKGEVEWMPKELATSPS